MRAELGTSRPGARSARLTYVLALVLDLVGAGAALLIALRSWQSVTTPRAAMRADVLALSGRTVDAAPTAFALVALAGVVAVLATRGLPRRLVGAVLVVSGGGLVWRSIEAGAQVSKRRARELVTEHHQTVDAAAVVPRIAVHLQWPILSAGCGVLIFATGLLVASRGHRWEAMSARYEARPERVPGGASGAADDDDRERARAAAALWTAIDRGEDPTDSAGQQERP